MRGESFKAVCAFLMIVSILAGLLSWFHPQPGSIVWATRIGSILVGLLAAGLLFHAMARRDKVPDELRPLFGNYFNRNGFCFAFVPVEHEGGIFMEVFYQNHFSKHCEATVALRPKPGFWLRRPDIPEVRASIDCEGAEFGRERVPFQIPGVYQGKRHWFEAGATVSYPDGKGQQQLFFDGILVRANADFQCKRYRAFQIFAALFGTRVAGPKIKLELPLQGLSTSEA